MNVMAKEKPIVSQPSFDIKPDGYYFYWLDGPEENINISVTRIKEDERRSAIEAEIEVSTLNGQDIITYVRANLLSQSARDTLVRSIERSCVEGDMAYYPWQAMINQICTYTIRDIRKGEPVIMLTAELGKTKPEYLLPPLFVKNAANIIYADRSSAKSLFMTLVDIALSLPWHDNNIGFNINGSSPHKVLFLDWENDANIVGWNKECLVRGTGIEWCDLPYLHCSRPLADSVDYIRDRIVELQSDTIIVDSLGMAVGDDLNLTKPAFAFWGALRQLPVTPIIIAHTSKDINNKRKTVYGNAYYENEARSVWEVTKEQQPNTPELNITLHNRKPPPFSGLHEPLGFHFIFDGDKTMVESAEPEQDKRLNDDTPPSEPDVALEIIWSSNKPLTAQEILIASEGRIKATNIYTVLGRVTKKKEFKVGKDDNGRYFNII